MDQSAQSYHVFETAHGFCGIAWNAVGITCFRLPTGSADAAERLLLRRIPGGKTGLARSAGGRSRRRREAIFRRRGDGLFSRRSRSRRAGAFFAAVYDTVRRIGWGQTTTYGAVAKALGAGPEAARDVGQAMAKNPVPLIIPCHRVLAAGGKIGGFSAPGGSTREGCACSSLRGLVAPPPKAAQQAFGF